MVGLMQTTDSSCMAPLTDRSQTCLALAAAARLASDFARGMVPGTATTMPGVIVGDALQLMALAREVLHRAITLELAAGTTWGDLETEFGDETVRTEWAASRAQPESAAAAAAVRALLVGGDPAAEALARAAQLDEWSCRHREDGDLDDGVCPVTSSLERMDTTAELAHLARLEGRLGHVSQSL
ncbi:hypothetical protein [Pseudonocardia xishanensis]|uniref:DUF222 domain-containing protein n=1 Tax=Pseudonocardia xishanensis TaxID=630995 RepID=A0ABP8RU09_9PSEU